MRPVTNSYQMFVYIAEWLDALTRKDIERAEEWARICAEKSTVPQFRYEQRNLANLTKYSIDDHPRSKYIRVVATLDNGQRCAHAFVDRETGSVYKAAGWKAPAKGKDGKPSERYNLMNDESRSKLLDRCEFTGGYLYADQAK